MDFAEMSGSRYAGTLITKLQLDDCAAERFRQALLSGDAGKSAVVLTPRSPEGWIPDFSQSHQESWLPKDVFLVDNEEKAGKQTGYGEGWFYPLDLSSVWESAALSAWAKPVRRFLDMCAAPGGKSMLCARRLQPGEHFANEIESARLGILRHNLKRCGLTQNVYTQRMHPRVWAESAPESFDGIWVDAPCSGQSLLAKGIKNQGCFHPAIVKGNAKRQKGILAATSLCVAPGGFLAYSTCSFSLEENEQCVAWFLKKHPEFSTREIPLLSPWRSPISEEYCYRLMPQHGLGSGGFVTLFEKAGTAPELLPELPGELRLFPIS